MRKCQGGELEARSEMVPHIASDVIFAKGGGEAITMNGGVGGGVVDEGHVGGVFQGIYPLC